MSEAARWLERVPERPGPVWAAVAGLALIAPLAVAYPALATAMFGWLVGFDPTLPPVAGYGISGVAALIGLAAGLMTALVVVGLAVGLVARQRWAWWGALLFGVVACGTGCLPVGLVVVGALLHPEVRGAYALPSAPPAAPEVGVEAI